MGTGACEQRQWVQKKQSLLSSAYDDRLIPAVTKHNQAS